MKTTTKRAAKGGEFGANGEWYEGGKFINTIPENRKKEGSSRRGSGKVEIEPYVWVVAPEGTSGISLYKNLAGVFGKVIDGKMVLNVNPVTLRYFGKTMEQVQVMADRYNAGERWL